MSKSSARNFGLQLAKALTEDSLLVEANSIPTGIHAVPVRLAPLYQPIDPLRTWNDRDQPRAVAGAETASGSARRILIASSLPDVSSAVALAGLAGCDDPLSFLGVMTNESLELFLVGPPDQLGFYADAWQVNYPDGLTLPAADPLDALPAFTVLLDLYAGSSYDRLVTSPASFWGQLCCLSGCFEPKDVLLYQVVFQPVRDPWQHNIAGLSHGQRRHAQTKSLDEPLFAAVIRIATTCERIAGPLGALAGRFTAAGMPFRYRSLADFRTVLSDEAIQDFVRQRATHTVGNLLTSSELAHFIHPPDPALTGLRLPVLHGLPVPERLRGNGFLLGTNTDRGVPVSVLYPWMDQYNTHAVIIGVSGKGKSAGLANWIRNLVLEDV